MSFGGILQAARYVGELLRYFNTTKKMAKEIKKKTAEANTDGNADDDVVRPAKRTRTERHDRFKLERTT